MITYVECSVAVGDEIPGPELQAVFSLGQPAFHGNVRIGGQINRGCTLIFPFGYTGRVMPVFVGYGFYDVIELRVLPPDAGTVYRLSVVISHPSVNGYRVLLLCINGSTGQ